MPTKIKNKEKDFFFLRNIFTKKLEKIKIFPSSFRFYFLEIFSFFNKHKSINHESLNHKFKFFNQTHH